MPRQYGFWASNLSRLAGMHMLTYAQLAELIGVTPQTISLWRTGGRHPSTEAFVAVGQLFELDPVSMVESPFQEVAGIFDTDRYVRVEAKIRPVTQSNESAGKVLVHPRAQQ